MNHILYLHGFASSPASSKARFFAQYLRDRGATVDIPDLASGDFENLTLTSQLDVIERAAAGQTASRPVALIGSSMGGYLAALYAQRHPEIARLVLLAPAFCFARRWAERLGENAVTEWRRTGAIEVFHYGENRTRRLAYSLLEDARQFPDYPDVRQPALIFHGEHDDIVPSQFSVEFAAAHPNAHLEILDSGHELLNVLDYMAPKVAAFLGAD
jgi:pimeloyl-ACP methyl ester carboxylesterase